MRTGLDNIARWARRNGDLPACHAEWKTIIEQRSWNDIRALLLADSDEGQRLRSTHPFIGIISDEERAAIHMRREQLKHINRGVCNTTVLWWKLGSIPTKVPKVPQDLATAERRPCARS